MTVYTIPPRGLWARVLLRLFAFLMFLSCQLQAQAPGWDTPQNIKGSTLYPSDFFSMAVTPSGKVFALWQENNQPPSDLLAQLFLATNDGQGWTMPVAITDTGSMNLAPDIALDSAGHPHVVWAEYASSEILYQYFDGVKWSTPQNVSQTPSGESYYPRIAIDKDNTAHIVWHDNVYGSFQVLYRSFNRMSGWSPTALVSDSLYNGDFPRLAVDRQGSVHIAYTRRMPPDGAFEVFSRKFSQGAWSPIERITNDDSLASDLPWISLDRNDTPVIVWAQQRLPRIPFSNGVCFSVYRSSSWSLPASIKDTTESEPPSLSFDKTNRAHLTWSLWDPVSKHSDVILYSSGTIMGADWSPPIRISAASSPGDYEPIVAADTVGFVHVLWRSNDHGIYYTRQSTVVSVEPQRKENAPFALTLLPNYPNPFNSTTLICYRLPSSQNHVSLKVFDVLGREVKELVQGEQAPGEHIVSFDAEGISSGVYFYRLQFGALSLFRRMLLVR